MAILSIGELLGMGPSELSGLVPYSSLEYSGAVITGISGSAIGGQGGGSDPSAISAIASAYAESAASSKVDTTAFNDCCSAVNSALSGISAAVSGVTGNTGTYLPASASGDFQPSGDYAFNSSVSGKLDGSASSTWYPKEGNPSGFLTAHQSLSGYATETYVDSSVSGKQDASGMSAYALSSDVSGVVDTVSANSASWGGGGGTGDYVEKSALNVNIGSGNTSTDGSFVAGVGNSASGSVEFGMMPFVYGSANVASAEAFAQGIRNTARDHSFAQGHNNSASNGSFAQGYWGNHANFYSFAQGSSNRATDYSFAQGMNNSAVFNSFAQGTENTASSWAFVHGVGNSGKNGAVVFGQWNGSGDGSSDSAALVIGNGTSTSHRHNLMLVTRDGEIRMYSGTGDGVGIGIVASIRAMPTVISSVASSYAKSSVSSVVDTVSSNSAAWGGSAVDSATVSAIASSYAESAVSSKQDSSAMSSYALSADVSGVIDTVSSNSASWGGNYVETSAITVAIGSTNTSTLTSFVHGKSNNADNCGMAQGSLNYAKTLSFAQGGSSRASYSSMSQGSANSANTLSFAQGGKNSAVSTSFAQGIYNLASSYSFAQGSNNTAKEHSLALGIGNSATFSATAFGQMNLHGNGSTSTGDSAAFVIGDGEWPLTGAPYRHDLMLVTKDGELRMYSGSADTSGLPLVATLRAISAWATANGWTGM